MFNWIEKVVSASGHEHIVKPCLELALIVVNLSLIQLLEMVFERYKELETLLLDCAALSAFLSAIILANWTHVLLVQVVDEFFLYCWKLVLKFPKLMLYAFDHFQLIPDLKIEFDDSALDYVWI